MKTILLKSAKHSGKYAIVDDEDYELLVEYPWYATKGKTKSRANHYATTNTKVNGSYRTILMHRLILKANSKDNVDHINGNGLDNRRSNLRICDKKQNNRNRIKINGLTSKYKGVCKRGTRPNLWYAQICCNYKQMHIGCFSSEVEAAKAYDEAAKQYFGEFARLNFPDALKQLTCSGFQEKRLLKCWGTDGG